MAACSALLDDMTQQVAPGRLGAFPHSAGVSASKQWTIARRFPHPNP